MSKLSLKEIAKLVRTDIKTALKAGELPKGIKVSVTTEYFSMGCALRVYVMALPEGHALYNPEWIAHSIAHPHEPMMAKDRFAPEASALLAKLEAIVDEYHEDRSIHSGGDTVWNVNFYKTIDFHWELESADRKRIEAKIAAEKAAAEKRKLAAEKPRYRVLAICTPVQDD